jgi:hypothetical protein
MRRIQGCSAVDLGQGQFVVGHRQYLRRKTVRDELRRHLPVSFIEDGLELGAAWPRVGSPNANRSRLDFRVKDQGLIGHRSRRRSVPAPQQHGARAEDALREWWSNGHARSLPISTSPEGCRSPCLARWSPRRRRQCPLLPGTPQPRPRWSGEEGVAHHDGVRSEIRAACGLPRNANRFIDWPVGRLVDSLDDAFLVGRTAFS